MDSEKQGYLGNLRKKSKPQLLDLLQTQERLLANKTVMARLPDKGQKIVALKEQIKEALTWYNTVDDATNALSKLHIARRSSKKLDSDDDEFDRVPSVFETLATRTIEPVGEKDSRPKPTSRPADDADSGVQRESRCPANPADAVETSKARKEPFVLYKTKLEPSKKPSKPAKDWRQYELFNARSTTKPQREIKILSLQESLDLAKQHAAAIKERQWEHAAVSLSEKLGSVAIEHDVPEIPTNNLAYREIVSEDEHDDEDDDNVQGDSDDDSDDIEADADGN